MEYSRAGFDVNGEVSWWVGSLYDFLSRLEDRRDARGIRYKLASYPGVCGAGQIRPADRYIGMGAAPERSIGQGAGVEAPPSAAPDDLQRREAVASRRQ